MTFRRLCAFVVGVFGSLARLRGSIVQPLIGGFGFFRAQPPSGGCVLKLKVRAMVQKIQIQPPSGGCVLKLLRRRQALERSRQPPSGGCVLKLFEPLCNACPTFTAAFRRLCVETAPNASFASRNATAAFRRLCVETTLESLGMVPTLLQPPSGGCVLKRYCCHWS